MTYPHATERIRLGRVSVVTPPADVVISTADLKTHLRVDHDDEDDQIAAALAAAVGEIEAPNGWLGRSLITQTLRLTYDCEPPDLILIPGSPVQAISAVEYRQTDNTFATVAASDYHSDLTCSPARLWAERSWPATRGGPDQFRVTYTAGYGDAGTDVPALIKQWLKMRVGDWYRDRETTILGVSPSELPHGIHMLSNLRVRI